MRTVAVVLAGGSGRRFGGDQPKQLRLLAGRTLLEHCVAAFDRAPGIDEVLVVSAADLVAETAAQVAGYAKVTGVIPGGTARSDSARQAIAALRAGHPAGPGRDCNVLLHDAARPLVDQRIIADCVTALATWTAIGVVVPSTDTIVEVRDGVLGAVLPRESLARCQTPQGFRLSVLGRAHDLAVPIGAVTGSERNLKVTHPGDLDLAELFLSQSRDR
jgi:2-C-methyl-D-erythritol 4-phosphate cytidylyltransferase